MNYSGQFTLEKGVIWEFNVGSFFFFGHFPPAVWLYFSVSSSAIEPAATAAPSGCVPFFVSEIWTYSFLNSQQASTEACRQSRVPYPRPVYLPVCKDIFTMAEDLVLDRAIRDWVLIPLSVVMVLIGVLRYFVSKLMRSYQTPDRKVVKEGQVVLRARNLRAAAGFIPTKSFWSRRVYFTNEENGLLHVPKGQAQNPQAQMFSDPNMAMDMMKKNISMIVPQTLTFTWVNFFFSGFVAAKIPFPLTQRFRGMLQNGIDLSTVDVSYVSSRSWYFLNLFGLRGLFTLILGEENATDDTQRMMQMSGFGFDPTRQLFGQYTSFHV
ncbi:ER membrane protein complex subunit 3-like isoform X3 [Zingiber officinale]|uniref:ER membrane protein complex subunit 3-like isoform X3 n=1 Tax=Zingiber officinale TaxID=94328 RepID=UPI001C4BA733|nr:ER membrane protein complex subunit 3-like isoform X3 [Zingiber officinale]